MKTHAIAIANQKGGVGKTTSAISIAACLALMDRPTLLIDLDPQANATSGLGIEKSRGRSVYAALLGESDLTIRIEPTREENLHLIPSELDLAGAEVELAGSPDVLTRFSRILEPIREQCSYEFVVIDCPPSLGILTMNAMTAADSVIIPMQCEYYALEGLSVILQVIDRLRQPGRNPDLRILGILMTMFSRQTRLAKQVVEEVTNHFGDIVFPTRIPRTVRLSEAPSHGESIFDYDPASAAAEAYREVTVEIIRRLQILEGEETEETPAETAGEGVRPPGETITPSGGSPEEGAAESAGALSPRSDALPPDESSGAGESRDDPQP